MAKASGLTRFAKFCKSLALENGKAMALHAYERRMLKDFFEGCRETLVLISKKNGKSTLLAAVALDELAANPDAQIAIVASSREQAMILFEQARGFIQRTPELQAQFRVLRGYREIRRRDPDDPDNPKALRGMVKVYAADADTADGWLGDLVLVDELHRHKSLELYSVLRDGLGPREGRMITISTAGETHDSPLGILRARAYEHDVERDGAYRYVRLPGFCMHEWALDAGDDVEDMALVKQANPAPWQTPEILAERYASPSMTAKHWARFACGIWGLGATSAFDTATWESIPQRKPPARGARITLGFDGARRRDGTALVGCDIKTGGLFVLGYWEKPADAGDDWEVPEAEVDQAVEYAMDRWDVFRLYGDPPFWESALDRWAGEHGQKRVVRWWTNRIKATAMALRAFRNDMRPDEMAHDGDPKMAEHIGNAIQKDTRMVEDGEPLWVIQKDSRDSPNKIDLAMAAMLAWKARGDAIAGGATDQYATAQW